MAFVGEWSPARKGAAARRGAVALAVAVSLVASAGAASADPSAPDPTAPATATPDPAAPTAPGAVDLATPPPEPAPSGPDPGGDAASPAPTEPTAGDAPSGDDGPPADVAPEAQAAPDDGVIEPAAIGGVAIGIGYDGTAVFDTNDAQGNDSGPTNGIVRTNDFVQYNFQYNTPGPTTTPRIVSTLPAGMSWDANDPTCTGTGTTPLPTGIYDSVTQAPGGDRRLLVCQLPSTTQSVTDEIGPVAKVAVQANGTVLPVSFTADDASNTPVTSDSVPVRVSAGPFYDLRKISRVITLPSTGPDGTTSGIADGFVFGITVAHPTRSGRVDGIKGMAPLADPMTFTDDLSQFSPNARLWTWGAVPGGCRLMTTATSAAAPASRIGITPSATAANSVPDSGTVSCTEGTGSFGVTVSGADTSGSSFPTQYASGAPMPANFLFVAVGLVYVWYPSSDVVNGQDGIPGTGDDNTLAIQNTLTGFDPDDVTGQSNYGAGTEALTTCYGRPTDPCFNTVQYTQVATGTSNKSFRDYTTNLFPTGASALRSADLRAGLGYRVRGDVVIAPRVVPVENVTLCDVFDRSSLRLVSGNTGGPPGQLNQTAGGTAQPGDYVIEYGAATTPPATYAQARASRCEDADATWSTDPADAALGGSLTPNGYRDSVDRVRMRFLGPLTPEADYHLQVFLEVYSASTMDPAQNPSGTVLANFGQVKDGATPAWRGNTFNPVTFGGNGMGDRILLVPGEVRVAKSLVESSPGSGTQVLAGQFARFRIAPTANQLGSVPGGPLRDVVVTDVLPATTPRLTVDPVSVTSPPGVGVEFCDVCDGSDWSSVAPAAPHGVRWLFGDVVPDTALPALFLNARVPIGAPNGQSYANSAVISSSSDPSTLAARTSSASATVTAPSTVLATKEAADSVVPLGSDLTWSLTVRNATATPVTSLDVVDLLPWTTDGRAPASAFSGGFSAVAVAAVPAGLGVYVTAQDPTALDLADGVRDGTLDPGRASDPWYVAPGTGAWSCTLAQVGTPGCPAAAAVTGIRFAAPAGAGFTLPPAQTAQWRLTLTAAGNLSGDLYTNQFVGRVDEAVLQLPVTSPPVPIKVTAPAVTVVKDVCVATACPVDDDAVWAQTHTLPTGDEATYRITVTNTGVEPGDVTVTDALPAGLAFVPGSTVASTGDAGSFPGSWTVGSMEPGETQTLTYRAAAPAAGVLTNTADAAVTDRFDQRATASDDAVVTVLDADVTLTKTLTRADVAADGTATLTYTLTVTNTAPVAGAYDLTDELRLGAALTVTSATATGPAGVELDPGWDGVTGIVLAADVPIAAGQVHTYAVVVTAQVPFTVPPADAACAQDGTAGGLRNTASATSAGITTIATACEDAAGGQITIDKTGPATALSGGLVTWQIAVANTGPLDAGTFTVTDDLPAGLVLVEATGGPEVAGTTLTWTVPTLAAGDRLALTLTARLPADATTTLTNCAVFTAPGDDGPPQTVTRAAAAVVPAAATEPGQPSCATTTVTPPVPRPEPPVPTPPLPGSVTASPVLAHTGTDTPALAGVAALAALLGAGLALCARRPTRRRARTGRAAVR